MTVAAVTRVCRGPTVHHQASRIHVFSLFLVRGCDHSHVRPLITPQGPNRDPPPSLSASGGDSAYTPCLPAAPLRRRWIVMLNGGCPSAPGPLPSAPAPALRELVTTSAVIPDGVPCLPFIPSTKPSANTRPAPCWAPSGQVETKLTSDWGPPPRGT